MARVVVLKGSPRRGGNTDTMADAFIEAARARGHEVQDYAVGRMSLEGCRACMACFRMGKPCVNDRDGWNPIAEAILAADVVVMASPTYFFGLSSQLKAAIDRLYCFNVAKPEGIYGKKCALICCCSVGEDGMDGPRLVWEKAVGVFKWDIIGEVLVPACGSKGKVANTDGCERAAALAGLL